MITQDILKQAIESAGGRLFRHVSCDPKWNAQRNLSGLSHYVDDDTLRFHNGRVLSTRLLADGLVMMLRESVALDMYNTKRGQRCVAFDVFGNSIIHPSLDETFSSEKAADKAFCKAFEAFDLVAHYRETLKSKLHWLKSDAAKVESALEMLNA